jgi:hypothetical protein
MESKQPSEMTPSGGAEIIVMPPPAASTTPRYAVIEAIRSEGDRERFAIAYLSEPALHTVIATACIIAIGFLSREEAIKACAAPVALAS